MLTASMGTPSDERQEIARVTLAVIFIGALGVVGGLVAFGVVGIFVGPTVLAVAYRLLDEWVSAAGAPQGEESRVS